MRPWEFSGGSRTASSSAAHFHDAIGAAYAIIGTPAVLAAPASGIGGQQATLNAGVYTLGLAGSYFFRYGTSPSSLTSETTSTALTLPATPVNATALLTGLQSGVTYYFQVVVTTKGGTTEGAVLPFTTQ